MARGNKKHLKRLNAPKHWMLDKMGGAWAPRPSTGPHKLRECLPVIIILRNRLKLALNRREVMMICKQKKVQVDGKVRSDPCFPAGFMDVVTLGDAAKAFDPKASTDRFRLMYDVKGRFTLLSLTAEEAKMKLCKVTRAQLTQKKIPYVVTHDGRTIRYANPDIKVGDTVVIDIKTGKITETLKREIGTLVTVTKGRNCGRVGELLNIERHPGSFDIVTIKDARGTVFATRKDNLFVIGSVGKDGFKPRVALPKGNGVKLSILEERAKRL